MARPRRRRGLRLSRAERGAILMMSGGGAGNVWSYNFSRNNPVGVGYTYMQASYTSHTAGAYMSLYEGFIWTYMNY